MSTTMNPRPAATQIPLIASDETQLRQGLQECLDNIEPEGSFALFEQSENPPNPGIHLRNGGTVGLPLSDRDAQAIIAASHAAPFGKGEETIVDTSVRKTWELSPVDFELRNPAWQAFIQRIVVKVASGLGVDATGKGVSAELYKMLLYDEGAMFKPHQDSEKAPRMFATLVVALPSKHDGGEVRVTHAGKTEVFETSRFSDYGTSYLAWFADVMHEVKPVLSGRRLVLTYNLVHTTFGSHELSATSNKGLVKLRSLMTWWKANVEVNASPSYAYLLEHQYTDVSLSFDALKGHDQQVVKLLRQVCNEQNLCLYLANIDMTIEGGCDGYGDDDDDDDDYGWGGGGGGTHKIIDEIDRNVTLTRVVQLDGVELARDLAFNEEFFIRADPLRDLDPDDEDYTGYTGNEGVSTTHFYHRAVAIIMPTNYRAEFFFPPEPSNEYSPYEYWRKPEPPKSPKVAGWLTSLSNALSQNPEDQETRDFLGDICKIVIQRTPPFDEEDISLMFTTLVDLNYKELVLEACDVFPSKASSSAWRSMGVALLKFSLHSVLPKLATKMVEITRMSDRLDVIFALRTGFETEAARSTDSEGIPIIESWIKSEVDRALSTSVIDSVKDGLALSQLSKTVPKQETFTKILPAVKRNVHFAAMAVAFVNDIFDSGTEGSIAQDTVQKIFRDVVADLADRLTLKFFELPPPPEEDKKKYLPSYYRRDHARLNAPSPKIAIDPGKSRSVAIMLCHCQELELRSELDQLLYTLGAESGACKIEMFEAIFFPFLKTLKSVVLEKQIVVQNSPYQALFRQVLTAYIDRYVQAEPRVPNDWARARVSCTCQDCVPMNSFLDNPHQQTARFTLAQKRRDHLQHTMEATHRGFQYFTDRNGSPQTLVITKTNDGHKYTVNEWNQRRAVAKRHITELGSEDLKEFLGEAYHQVMALEAAAGVNNNGQSSALMPSYSASNRVLSPPSRRRTPHDCIVIDDD